MDYMAGVPLEAKKDQLLATGQVTPTSPKEFAALSITSPKAIFGDIGAVSRYCVTGVAGVRRNGRGITPW